MAKIDGIVDEMVNYVSPAEGDAYATWRPGSLAGRAIEREVRDRMQQHLEASADPKQTINGVVPAPGGGYYVSCEPMVPFVSAQFTLSGDHRAAMAKQPPGGYCVSRGRWNGPPQGPPIPRPGQTWRSPTGEEGRIYDHTHEAYADVWHLRMTSGLRVREEHPDLVTAWSYVSGPTEPETRREEKDRVGALMVADRPEGVTERTWQAVVMAMGEGEDENGMRQKCAAARLALGVAERMRVVR